MGWFSCAQYICRGKFRHQKFRLMTFSPRKFSPKKFRHKKLYRASKFSECMSVNLSHFSFSDFSMSKNHPIITRFHILVPWIIPYESFLTFMNLDFFKSLACYQNNLWLNNDFGRLLNARASFFLRLKRITGNNRAKYQCLTVLTIV